MNSQENYETNFLDETGLGKNLKQYIGRIRDTKPIIFDLNNSDDSNDLIIYESDLENELFIITNKFIELRNKQGKALERSDEHDSNNNSFLAGHALNDYHNIETEIDIFRQRAKEIRDIIGVEKAKEICIECEHYQNKLKFFHYF